MINIDSSQTVDLSSCAAEPIHIIGRVQSFGYLIAISSDWIVNHLSVNCADIFGRPFEELVGTSAVELIASSALHDIRSRLQMLGATDAVDRIFSLDLIGDGRLFDVAIYNSGRSYVIEAEPAVDHRNADYAGFVRPMVARLRKTGSIDELCKMAARQLRGMTGFDRVMVYRFENDGAGEVIAESRASHIDSFLGLHFPASDIPAQARKLYCRNILRIIADVDDPTVHIAPTLSPNGEPLDLSMSGIRAVSPIHIEYLKNMGVCASMSVSIMRGGELWGLMACHHYAPLHLNYATRTAAELFGEFMSFLLEQFELREIDARKTAAMRLHDEIMARVASGATISEAFDVFDQSIGKVIAYDAIVGYVDGKLLGRTSGATESQWKSLARFLNTTGAGQVWRSDNVGEIYPAIKEFAEPYCGLLALPVSRSPRDYVILLRNEHARSVSWAGNPEKPVELGPNGARLTPRKSFELWKQERSGFSMPWSDDEISAAEGLRVTLLEVVLRMSDAAQREREQAGRKQDVLIAELNHRVRNLLNLVRGLVFQSQASAATIDEFAKVVGDRIYALARAHDQVTKMNWSPASVSELIATECRAYVGEKADRLVITGTDALVEPNAFATLALVFHELMTNSCKYGALSDRRGLVTVDIKRTPDDGISITWTESDGPPVAVPERRGFGSSIIEQSIPHELGGTTEVQYLPGGLTAVFSVPARHIAAFTERTEASNDARMVTVMQDRAALLAGNVLIVEDNMIIAMESEFLLQSLGATECYVASSVASALALIRDVKFSFALLDVNLGDETSDAVAAELKTLGIPFVTASGYGDRFSETPNLRGAPAITKPFSRNQLTEAISATMVPGDEA